MRHAHVIFSAAIAFLMAIGSAHADTDAEKAILQSLPSLKSFTRLTSPITMRNESGDFGISGVTWTPRRTTIGMHLSGGTVWYNQNYICTSHGGFLWSCDGGYNEDKRLRVKGKNNGSENFIADMEGFPRTYKTREPRRDNAGNVTYVEEEHSRGTVKIENAEFGKYTYKVNFDDVPLETLRNFSVNEGYCGSKGLWGVCDVQIRYFTEELEEQEQILAVLKKANLPALSKEPLRSVYEKYSKYDKVREFVARVAFSIAANTGSIDEIAAFTDKYKENDAAVKEAQSKIFSLVRATDSVAGYEWFIDTYPSASDIKPALDRIHTLMYDKATQLNTVAAYNTFVFTYPTASQVAQANARADELEGKAYTDLGFFSFFNKEAELEKKARALLIQAKQIERFPRDNNLSGERRTGYLIVANRMYNLLQQKFMDSDATLRYLESQDFKDFVNDFNSAMKRIRSVLQDIANNTERASRYTAEMVNVSRQGFSDAKADRSMEAYYTSQHRDWEKQVHYESKRK